MRRLDRWREPTRAEVIRWLAEASHGRHPDMPLFMLGLNARTLNRLEAAGITTMKELLDNYWVARVRALPGFGRGCFEDLADRLRDAGYQVRWHE